MKFQNDEVLLKIMITLAILIEITWLICPLSMNKMHMLYGKFLPYFLVGTKVKTRKKSVQAASLY